MTKTPKPKGKKLEVQTKAIIKLLTLWPTAKYSTIEEYIADTLGGSTTRVCIQQAREALGLGEPEHEEKTLKKKKYAEHIVLALVSMHGIGGQSETQFCTKVSQQLEEAFGERTNHLLVKSWTKDRLNEIKGVHFTKFKDLLKESQEELVKAGIQSEEEKRQVQLL